MFRVLGAGWQVWLLSTGRADQDQGAAGGSGPQALVACLVEGAGTRPSCHASPHSGADALQVCLELGVIESEGSAGRERGTGEAVGARRRLRGDRASQEDERREEVDCSHYGRRTGGAGRPKWGSRDAGTGGCGCPKTPNARLGFLSRLSRSL